MFTFIFIALLSFTAFAAGPEETPEQKKAKAELDKMDEDFKKWEKALNKNFLEAFGFVFTEEETADGKKKEKMTDFDVEKALNKLMELRDIAGFDKDAFDRKQVADVICMIEPFIPIHLAEKKAVADPEAKNSKMEFHAEIDAIWEKARKNAKSSEGKQVLSVVRNLLNKDRKTLGLDPLEAVTPWYQKGWVIALFVVGGLVVVAGAVVGGVLCYKRRSQMSN